MPRRPTTKASRSSRASAVRVPAAPTPITSGYNTPLSSAYPSTYASEAEYDVEDDVSKLAIGALTLQDAPTAPKPKKIQPFRFVDLPSELRIKVYGYHFADCGNVIDLDSDNYKRIHKKLGILRTCRAIYQEASHVFYSTRTFRLFPTQPGRFFKTKKPLLARLNARQRSWITSLELRLGPGWNAPPRGWVVNPALGLADCINVRRLTVFVECDPSDGVFKGFRRANGFYEEFSRLLLTNVLMGLPMLDRVHLDAWPSVKKSGAMMRGLIEVVGTQERKICWGPERGWTDQDEEEIVVFPSTAGIMSGMAIGVAVIA
ncbi:hypothetical protein OQA88_12670 [Cercophora sp. LCS_1]